MSGSLKPQDTLAAIGRVLADNDRRIRALENLGGGGDSEHNGTGDESTAVGTAAVASDTRSTALGDNATANGPDAVALGNDTVAGDTDTVIGSSAHTGGGTDYYGSVVVGASAQTSDTQGVAVGFSVDVYGYAGIGIGPNSRVDEDYGTAIGDHAHTVGHAGVAIGSGAHAAATDDTMAIGSQSDASGERSWALGAGATVTDDHAGVLRANSVEIQPDAFVPTETSLIVTDSSGARWAVTVDTTGHLTTTAL